MTKSPQLFIQLSKEKVQNLTFFLAIEVVGVAILQLFFQKYIIGQMILQLMPIFLTFGFSLKMLEVNEKIYTKSIWRSLPVSNARLYTLNLLSSTLFLFLFVAFQGGLMQVILKVTPIDFHFLDFQLTTFSWREFVVGGLTLIGGFAGISLVHLCYLALSYYNSKMNRGLAKFVSYLFVIVILVTINTFKQYFAVKYIFHSQQALDQSIFFLLFTVILYIAVGIFLMPFAEVQEVN